MLRYFDVIAPSRAVARDDGRHARLLKTLARVELLILDGVDGLTSTAS
ncbi:MULTISPECIES: ATP-binding protein [unclassified Bradyrhizobium]|nr:MULTISPECIES: ATP-binding protein [unclassified Bradyrhizobium]